MFAWEFQCGPVVVSRLKPTCTAKDLVELGAIEKDFVFHHYHVHAPGQQPVGVKRSFLREWRRLLGAGDHKNKLGEQRRTYLVARSSSGRIEGYLCFLKRAANGKVGPHVWISSIAVRKTKQESGIGKALFQGLLKYLATLCRPYASLVKLAVLSANREVWEWYERLGFEHNATGKT